MKFTVQLKGVWYFPNKLQKEVINGFIELNNLNDMCWCDSNLIPATTHFNNEKINYDVYRNSCYIAYTSRLQTNKDVHTLFLQQIDIPSKQKHRLEVVPRFFEAQACPLFMSK